MLSTATAPVSAAPIGPSSTTAASVAAELGDHADCRAPIGVDGESQIRNSNCRMIRSPQKLLCCCCAGHETATRAVADPTTSAV